MDDLDGGGRGLEDKSIITAQIWALTKQLQENTLNMERAPLSIWHKINEKAKNKQGHQKCAKTAFL